MDSIETKFKQVRVRLTIPSEQAQEFSTRLRQWMTLVPTIYVLDICSIGHVKSYLSSGTFKDKHHEESIRELREIDTEINCVSYVAALIEKASDQRSKFSVEGFVEEAKRDWDAMNAFFKAAPVYETWELIENHVRELFGAHPEQAIPAYLSFLEFANAQGLHNNVPKADRYKMAQTLSAKGVELGIPPGHPVLIVTFARIYGCEDAKKVLKFAGKPENFNPGNALGDIQVIPRIYGTLAALIQRSGGRRYVLGKLKTADSALSNLLHRFSMQSVVTRNMSDGAEHEFSVSIDERGLFPDLFDPEGALKDEACQEELMKLFNLMRANFIDEERVAEHDAAGGAAAATVSNRPTA